ncbi:MAG TPA: Crp/Fnr family transcriptional regulator [bacterium]|nr:Crp/Fnr family transcriptional regulator [bacterium]
MEKIEALKRTEFFGPLNKTELQSLAQACLERRLKKGQVLFHAGDESRGLFVIAKGSVRAMRGNAQGREQVIHIEKAGTTIAEVPVFDDRPYPSTVVAEEDCELLFISKPDVKRLFLEHPGIAWAALRLLAGRLRKTASLVESISLKEVDQRLAAFLFQEFTEKRLKKLKLPTNTVIATRLGSVREVVSRAFSKLQAKGFITIDKSRNAEILDAEGLRRHAGG